MDGIEQDIKQGPIQPDVSKLLTIIKNMKEMARERQRDPSKEILDDIIQELEKLEMDIENVEKKFCKTFLWFPEEESATGSCDSRKNVTDGPAAPTGENVTAEHVEDFINKLFAKYNNKVGFKDFPVLTEILNELRFHLLKPIDSKIGKACGGNYNTSIRVFDERILMSAAVKEMENCQGLEQLNEQILLNWGAAFNKAGEVGFPLDFAKRHLEEIARAYFGAQDGLKQEYSRSKAKLNVIEQCLKAANAFQGKGIVDGLFPS